MINRRGELILKNYLKYNSKKANMLPLILSGNTTSSYEVNNKGINSETFTQMIAWLTLTLG